MTQVGAPAQRRSQTSGTGPIGIGKAGSGQTMAADRRSQQLGNVGPPIGLPASMFQLRSRVRAVTRNNPFPLAFTQDQATYEPGGTLKYVRTWVRNLFTSQHDPGQTSYSSEALRTLSGGKPADVPISRGFVYDTLARTFGQYAQSFPNGGWEKMPSGNRYFPEILQLRAKPYTGWEDWARTQQVAIMTEVQVQQTSPYFPKLTAQPGISSLSQYATVLPTIPTYLTGVYD